MHVLYCKQQIQLGKLGLQVWLFIPFVTELFKTHTREGFIQTLVSVEIDS